MKESNFWIKLGLVSGAALIQVAGGVFLPLNLALPVVWLALGWLVWKGLEPESVLGWAFWGGLELDLLGNGWLGMQGLALLFSWGGYLLVVRLFFVRNLWVRLLGTGLSLAVYYLTLWSLTNIFPTI